MLDRGSRAALGCMWVLSLGLSGCAAGGGGTGKVSAPDAGGDRSRPTCLGRYRCEGGTAIACDADAGAGGLDCAKQGKSCDEVLGCIECSPGEGTCANGKATWCRDDGTLAKYDCDPVQGMVCMPDGCAGPCALSEVHDSYIGCDYYPTVTLNPVWSGFDFAIAVSNTSDAPAKVTVTRGDDMIAARTVAAGALETITLPWVEELKGGDIECTTPPARGASRVARDGAYRVRSDQPVTVYQFSPLDYQSTRADCPVLSACSSSTESRCLSYSNDASLLLPATALTGSYTALAWPSQTDGSGFIAVTATEDGTSVEVLGQGTFVKGGGVDAKGKGTVKLDRGDVLELVAANDSDVSGTRIRATKPVQVIGGQSCAYVPSKDVLNCDHVEETTLPEDTLGQDYLVTLPAYADFTTPTPHVLRIAAIEKDTTLTFDPAVHVPVTLGPGKPFELELTGATLKDVRVISTKPVLVATYMEGQEALPGQGTVGDPSMSIAVPVEQFRSAYLFTAPVTYMVNLANVVAKLDAKVRIDGTLLDASELTPIGASGYGVAHVLLSSTSNGVHQLEADQEVGLTVYGYGQYTSYMYPGGADLDRITVPPVL